MNANKGRICIYYIREKGNKKIIKISFYRNAKKTGTAQGESSPVF
jgi:hypothetical protein